MEILLVIKHPILFHGVLKTLLKSVLHFRVVEEIFEGVKVPTKCYVK